MHNKKVKKSVKNRFFSIAFCFDICYNKTVPKGTRARRLPPSSLKKEDRRTAATVRRSRKNTFFSKARPAGVIRLTGGFCFFILAHTAEKVKYIFLEV